MCIRDRIGELTLLDFLEQAEGKNQNLADKQIVLAGGGTLNFTILTSGGYGAVSYTHLMDTCVDLYA